MPTPGKSFAPACGRSRWHAHAECQEEIEPIEHKTGGEVPALRATHANTAHDMTSASYELEVRMDPRWTQSIEDSSGSGRTRKLQNIAEVLANLTYLTLKDADRPERVRVYMWFGGRANHIAKHVLSNESSPASLRKRRIELEVW
jgi:hypothetical protein